MTRNKTDEPGLRSHVCVSDSTREVLLSRREDSQSSQSNHNSQNQISRDRREHAHKDLTNAPTFSIKLSRSGSRAIDKLRCKPEQPRQQIQPEAKGTRDTAHGTVHSRGYTSIGLGFRVRATNEEPKNPKLPRHIARPPARPRAPAPPPTNQTRRAIAVSLSYLSDGLLVEVADHESGDPAGDPELHRVVDARPVVLLLRGGVLRNVPEPHRVICVCTIRNDGGGGGVRDDEAGEEEKQRPRRAKRSRHQICNSAM